MMATNYYISIKPRKKARIYSRSSRGGWSKGRGEREMFRAVVELRLGEKCARVGCVVDGNFFL
jgi:hypothetical protein